VRDGGEMPGWPGETEHTVTAAEGGPLGFMDEIALVSLLQRSRRAWWAALGGAVAEQRYRIWDLRLKFLHPTPVGEALVVRPQCDEIAKRSVRLRFRVFSGGTDAFVAEASTLLILVDARGRDIDVPASVLDATEALEGRRFIVGP